MVSGPDLGGGFLFQLTLEPGGPHSRFTYHAQEGGSDAGGPPVGDPAPFGWSRAPGMCMFGGRVCWHRTFELPFEAMPRVRAAYNRTRFTMEAVLAQQYRGAAVAIPAALALLADRLAPELAREGIAWWLGGSAGLFVRGAHVAPRDIDLGTTREGVAAVGRLLEEYLTEPVGRTTRPDGAEVVGGRAFVGTLREGARVEWCFEEADPARDALLSEWRSPPDGPPTELVSWEGRSIPVSRPEFSLVRAAERGDPDRLAAAAWALRRAGVDRTLLTSLLEDARRSPAARAAARRALDAASSD